MSGQRARARHRRSARAGSRARVLGLLLFLGCQTDHTTRHESTETAGAETAPSQTTPSEATGLETERSETEPAADADSMQQEQRLPCDDGDEALAYWQGDRIRFDRPIEFDIDSDAIRPSSFPTLDSLAARLCERSDVRVEIQVHTDGPHPMQARAITEGDRARRRAESIRNALSDRGVPRERMDAEGYPRTCKIQECAEVTGRRARQACYAANRRVEVHVVPAEAERPDIPSSIEVQPGAPLGCRMQ